MSGSGKKFAKNVSVLMGSQLVTWVLAFLVALFQPRYLGATAIGQLSISYSIWIIIEVLAKFGMDTHLVKLIARDPSRTGELVGTSIVLRCIFFVIGFALSILYLYLLHYPIEIFYISSLLGLSTIFSLITAAINAALMGIERMEYSSVSVIISKVFYTVVILTLLFMGFNVYWIAAVSIVTNAVNMAFMAFFLRRHYKLTLRLNLPEAWEMLRASNVYLVTGLILIVYQQIDKLFISTLVTTEAVGWYGTAMNLFGTLMFVPVVLGTVLFPTLSRKYADGMDHLAPLVRRSFDLMFMMSLPVGFGVAVVAEPLVLLMYGPEFRPSGQILAVLGIVLILTYLNTMLGQLLISVERTGAWNIVMLIATILTVPLDLLLVPWAEHIFANGALGGAFSFLVTELMQLSVAILLLPKGTLYWGNVRTVLLTMLAGVAMVASSWWLRDHYLILAILAGAITYTLAVLLLRIIPREDMLLVWEGVSQVLRKLRGRKGAPAGARVGGNEA